MNESTENGIMLEPATEKDSEFIEKVYFSTREDEFAMLGWTRQQLEMFLRMQFEAQRQSYEMQFPAAEHSLIYLENAEKAAIGRLIVERTEKEIRLVDIAILSEFRGRKIGTKIINDLIVEAEIKNLPVTLTVSKTNVGAFRLYQKLGFNTIAEDAVIISMEKI